jgi:DNA-directed RNA polymerase specialized sigma24 family protein
LSVAQTAALLGCTEGTVKSQTARALQDLGTVLRAAGVTGIELREEAPTS